MIGLSTFIVQRFEAWFERFGDGSPEREEFDWKSFGAEGCSLAQAPANVVWGGFMVEYKLQEVLSC